MDKNKVKIELYKSRVKANFSHYISGNLYYTVQLEEGLFQFPIATVEEGPSIIDYDNVLPNPDIDTILLSSDLGTTSFNAKMEGRELNRWIGQAIDAGTFTEARVEEEVD